MVVYRKCPTCGAYKAFRLEGEREWDTNTFPQLVVDDAQSCSCVLTDDQWVEMTASIEDSEFIPDYDDDVD